MMCIWELVATTTQVIFPDACKAQLDAVKCPSCSGPGRAAKSLQGTTEQF